MNAECRDDVFRELRKQGIKAIKVVAADGSKANGEIRGVRKRVLAASVICAAIVAGLLAYFAPRGTHKNLPTSEAKPLPRQEIKGDRERVKLAADGFTNKAEAFLARFAEPGRAFTAPEIDWPTRADFEAVIGKPIKFTSDEFTEQIDLKRIVEGLKAELSAYLKGGGYLSGYMKDLITRQKMEIEQRDKFDEKVKSQIDAYLKASGKDAERRLQEAYDYWLKANAQLQSMGIYPLPLYSVLKNCQMSFDKTFGQ